MSCWGEGTRDQCLAGVRALGIMSCWGEGTRDQCLAGVRALGINVLLG